MRYPKFKLKDLLYLAIVAILVIPQTRRPVQVFINKGPALFGPSVLPPDNQHQLANYHWILEKDNGDIFNFKDTKGRVVLINFWATWCPPCIAEMPSFQKLYNDFQNEMEFVMVSNDKFETIKPYLLKNNYTFPVYRPLSDFSDQLNVTSIPRTFLIDKSGNVVIDKTGVSNWNSKVVRNVINELITDKEE
ncbi:TlpA family protein disulfide reductase [Aestuariivivens sediminis]|uniref:TlpA family protein disulfide reductase n=1 Tax=Aestuariivivens sediminis TaxID=2913557 RepID=UPI001F560862|nr:TlpA disulfide reductase family protein [Aestuariivivens sediminis]